MSASERTTPNERRNLEAKVQAKRIQEQNEIKKNKTRKNQYIKML